MNTLLKENLILFGPKVYYDIKKKITDKETQFELSTAFGTHFSKKKIVPFSN